ncbi:transporter (CPA2 family) [Isoptericola jiangsuensis]|uniref:Transporter (CPA2 family) n=1 Tax=Isoptericola jiangsuensis TaxID=548579 RepID=A0A2A9EYD7_9MICO|nr:cation:proton antiporter [Isoptericola jiangsuensis]PFG43322.1 transporter (CPA2 family) [Isoptericola jiangsuensis]
MSTDTVTMLAVIAGVAVLAPFVVDRVEPWIRVPSVVVEILLGIVVGPTLLGLVQPNDVVEALSDLGLAFLMFLAGYEIEFSRIRGGPLRRAAVSWAASLALGLAVGLWIAGPHAGLVVGLALTTTALGVILPIVRDAGQSGTPFGDRVLAVGTVGEFGPILAIAFILSGDRPAETLLLLLAFAALAVTGAILARQPRHPRLGRLVTATLGTSSQVAVRLCVFVVVAMFAAASALGLDPVLGAFTAGILVHLFLSSSDPIETHVVESRLEGIGFGFLIPVFFVMSGVTLDVASLAADPRVLLTVPLYTVLFLLVRGVPTFVAHRRGLGKRDAAALGTLSATGLPLIVVVTAVGVDAGELPEAHAAALVAAGMLSVLVFPISAARMQRLPSSGGRAVPAADDTHPTQRDDAL